MPLRTAVKAEKKACRFVVAMGLFAMLIGALAVGQVFAAAPAQKTFKSPDTAVKALIQALKNNDRKGLLAIFGPGGEKLVFSGDKLADKKASEEFVGHYEEKNSLQQADSKTVILHVGNDDWPFPIPIVKTGKGWRFNAKAGEHEILARRIGRNELATIQTCLVYVDAQREYARKDRNSNGLLEYAQKFMSEPGKKDGLYWEAAPGEEESPLGPAIGEAVNKGYMQKQASDQPIPYHGYYYRILTAQGKDAPDGAYDYVVDGKMIGGFALVAYPAKYGNSGVMTFIVNQDGVVYQKNLGKDTAKIAQAMNTFDPDKTWAKVE